MSIYIFISDVASYIGKNKFDPTKSFERLWKKVDKDAILFVSDEINEDINSLSAEIEELQKSIKKMTRTKEKEIRELILKRDRFHLAFDQFSLSQRSLINKEFSQFNSIIDDQTMSPEKKRKVIQQELKNMEKTESDKILDIETKKTFESMLVSVTNTSHGIRKEESSLVRYKRKFGISDNELDVSQQFYKMEIFQTSNFKYYICGKMDGIQINGDSKKIIEVKNRTRGFFGEVRDYEMIQMQLYMHMTGINNCRLVEDFNTELNIIDVEIDMGLINDIMSSLKQFIQNFNNFLEQDPSIKKEYILSSQQTKKQFLEDHILPKEENICLL